MTGEAHRRPYNQIRGRLPSFRYKYENYEVPMARPELDNAVISEIKSARAEGLTLGQIVERMKAIREAGSVSTPMPGNASIAT